MAGSSRFQPEPTITARIPPLDIITVLLLLPTYRFPAGNDDFPTGSYRKSIEPETGIIKNRDVVLIHAGASGVGTAAIQLAKFFGAKVATTVGSDEKVDYCKKIDADKAVNYKHEPWINAMKEFNKDGFDSCWIIYSFQSGYQADKLSFTTLMKKLGTYIVEFDYNAKSSDELTIRKGDIITDALPSEDGWLKGECRGMIGHFPDNFVTALNKEKAKNRTFPTIQTGNKNDTLRKRSFTTNDASYQNGTLFQVKAVYTYLPLHDDEISMKPNDIINVTRMVEEGWYEGILNGKLGLFPSNYVTRIHDDQKNKMSQAVKQKPVNGLSELVKNEASKKNSPLKVRVLYDYKATADDELTLKTNDIVTIIHKNLEDEGWWKGEINGRVGVFPDNYVEELSPSMNLKHRPNTPENGTKHPSRILSKTKSANDSSHNYSDESHHTTKSASISHDEDHSSRNRYTEINNLDSKELNKQKPMPSKRPLPLTTKKNEHDSSKTIVSFDETNHHPQSTDVKNELKVHTPSPPSFQREPGQLESPRYVNRSFSLSNTNNSTLNGTTELVNPSYVNITTLEQLQKEFLKLKSSMDDMKLKFSNQIRDLINELDEEKKARATLHIEIERLQKLVQKSSIINS